MATLHRALSIGGAALAFAAMLDVSAFAAAPPKHKHHVRKATDISVPRQEDVAVAPICDGYYNDRPVAYRPYPYALPAPFPFGIGFDR